MPDDLRSRMRRDYKNILPVRPRPVPVKPNDALAGLKPAPQPEPPRPRTPIQHTVAHEFVAVRRSTPPAPTAPARAELRPEPPHPPRPNPEPSEDLAPAQTPQETYEAPMLSRKQRRQQNHAAKPARSHPSRLTSFKRKQILIPTVAGTVIVASAFIWLAFIKPPSQLMPPKQYTSQSVGFLLYFPTKLPKGDRIAPSSYNYKDGALNFAINTAGGQSISIGEEKVPTGLKASDIVPAPKSVAITKSDNIDLPGATSAISNAGDKTFISTVYGDTWYIMDVTGVPRDEALAINKAFIRVR